jgi:hypothetical protein
MGKSGKGGGSLCAESRRNVIPREIKEKACKSKGEK